jgi:hypothetical protein
MAQSMSQAHSATSVTLQETRQQHTAELERLTRAQEALVSAAAREASALECQHAQDRLAEMQVRLEASQSRIHELQHELQVCVGSVNTLSAHSIRHLSSPCIHEENTFLSSMLFPLNRVLIGTYFCCRDPFI